MACELIIMKEFSIKWVASKKPRKQRKYRANAPTHARRKMIAAHLDKALRAQLKKRSLQVRKDDEVTVKRGQFSGKSGKVTRVSLKKLKIYVENLKIKKVSGQEVEVPIDPSNVVITKLGADDVRRRKFTKRKGL